MESSMVVLTAFQQVEKLAAQKACILVGGKVESMVVKKVAYLAEPTVALKAS